MVNNMHNKNKSSDVDVTTKPFGTAKGERKAARVARAIAKQNECITQAQSSSLQCFESAETESARWDAFYTRGLGATYRDRHLLRAEFPELMGIEAAKNPRNHIAPLNNGEHSTRDVILLEVGCGRGSALFPILRANVRLFGIAFDFSAVAVRALCDEPEYSPERVDAFVGDVTMCETFVPRVLERGAAQYVTACWTFSALNTEGVRSAVEALASATRLGGLLCVRDFARGDMREHRFAQRAPPIEQTALANVYRRGDETVAAFFDVEHFVRLVQCAGWECVRNKVVERDVPNRAKGIVMKRRWLQAVFRRVS